MAILAEAKRSTRDGAGKTESSRPRGIERLVFRRRTEDQISKMVGELVEGWRAQLSGISYDPKDLS